jgi:membrane protein YdbS with pleckstrin-like domain
VNKLSKVQQERLILVAVGTVALMGAIWWFVVQPKQMELAKTEKDIAQKRERLSRAEVVLRNAGVVQTMYTNRLELLQGREIGMAPERGAYEWIINTINPFIQSRKGVNIVTFSEPTISDQGMLPRFPYRWATFHIHAIGFYQDFGKFFADFENSFPYFRIQNLDISGNAGPAAEEEKLGFTFDIVAPVVASETK